MKTLKKFLFFLSTRERIHAGLLLIMITIMALLDMIGVASILPFISVLTNSGLIETNIILNKMFKLSSFFGVETDLDFILTLGTVVFVLLIISLTFKIFTTYAQIRFIQMREYSISKRLVEGYLRQPYSWFLSRNSADLGKNILSEVGNLIGNGFHPLMELISKSSIVITLIILLIIVDPKFALIVSSLLGGAYFIIFCLIRNNLNQTGQKRLKNNQLRFVAVSEAFGAVKQVKTGGLEEFYTKSFSNSAKIYAETYALFAALTTLPRFILEAIAFGGIMLLLLYIVSQTGTINNALPIISLYVFAGYRLMPALQQIYFSIGQLTFVGPSLEKLYEDFKSLKSINKNQDQGVLSFNKTINLKNIYYKYPNTSRTILKNINLNIPKKYTVGLMGVTGSGKSTLVDIILGLLEPQKGTLEVDGKVITRRNLRSWQRSIGYVPQHIYLSDDSIEANIAFGVSPKDINQDLVKKASKIANLHKFIIDDLPSEYKTTIGERGVRLSGGQRQRIGIARALYNVPKILILDEATSALDNETEQVVIDAINSFSKNMTVIIISHRLSTVKNCDIIFKLHKGQLKTQSRSRQIK